MRQTLSPRNGWFGARLSESWERSVLQVDDRGAVARLAKLSARLNTRGSERRDAAQGVWGGLASLHGTEATPPAPKAVSGVAARRAAFSLVLGEAAPRSCVNRGRRAVNAARGAVVGGHDPPEVEKLWCVINPHGIEAAGTALPVTYPQTNSAERLGARLSRAVLPEPYQRRKACQLVRGTEPRWVVLATRRFGRRLADGQHPSGR